jgi:hypothetical protein
MSTSYPGALDDFVNPNPLDSQDDPSHSDQHSNANDAIEAVETELGINPRGPYADVRARLEAIEVLSVQAAQVDENVAGYTNTSFADLDALSTAAFSAPVSLTVETGTTALVIVSASVHRSNSGGGAAYLAYRVSGATTIAAADSNGARVESAGPIRSISRTELVTGLTAGSNVFELQARVVSGSAQIVNPSLTVITL